MSLTGTQPNAVAVSQPNTVVGAQPTSVVGAQPTTVVVNSTSALTRAVNTAKGPLTIELAPGTYSGVSFFKSTNSGPVTVVSEDPTHEATLTGLTVNYASNISFDKINFDGTSTSPGATLVSVYNSSNINLQDSSFHGAANVTLSNSVEGVVVKNSNNVTVSGSSFYDLHDALAHLNGDGFTASNNSFSLIYDDAIRGGGTNDVLISGNTITTLHTDPTDPDHPDAIQFWTSGTTAPTSNITIINNTYTRGDGGAAQGVFMRDELGGLPFTNVHILNNNFSGTEYNGIYVTDGSNITISGNTVSSTDTSMVPWIELRDVSNSTLSDNTAPGYIYHNTVGVTMTGNNFQRVSQDLHATVYANAAATSIPPNTAVPEPVSWLLLILGFATMGSALRRRRSRRPGLARTT